jgi:ADP-heptose:LPS heptosyltransferase
VPALHRIVVLRANGLGDHVVAQPALAALRAAYPGDVTVGDVLAAPLELLGLPVGVPAAR